MFEKQFYNNMNTEEQASKRACQRLREITLDECDWDNIEQYPDSKIIEDNKDEWSWYMQGWIDTHTYYTNHHAGPCITGHVPPQPFNRSHE